MFSSIFNFFARINSINKVHVILKQVQLYREFILTEIYEVTPKL